MDQVEEFFEIEQPTQVTHEIEQIKDEDFTSHMVGNEDKKVQKSIRGVGKIKVRTKDEEIKNKNEEFPDSINLYKNMFQLFAIGATIAINPLTMSNEEWQRLGKGSENPKAQL